LSKLQVYHYLLVGSRGFHDGDEKEQIRSKTRNKIVGLSKDKTKRTLKITWKTQNRENDKVARKSPIIERLQGEEEDLTAALHNSSQDFS